MNQSSNPYAPPVATVADTFDAGDDSVFIPGGRTVAAGRGLSWLVSGWQMFLQQPGAWIVMGLIFMVIYFVFTMIPFIGMLNALLLPLLAGGFMIASDKLRSGNGLDIGDLFAGFAQKLGPLCLLGVLTLAMGFAAMVAIFLVAGIGIASAGLASHDLSGIMSSLGIGTILLASLAVVVVMVLIYAAVWYAPALIVLHDLPVLEAMKMSFTGGMRNILPGLVYGLVFLVLAFIASLPVLLGWLVLTPVLWASIYAGYRDIYIQD